jgi:hypothetical protein
MKSALLQRWLASITAIALLLAVSAYLAHQHLALQKAGGAERSCELCLQIGSTATPPAESPPPDLLLRAGPMVPAYPVDLPKLAPAHAYLSRAPPHA